MCKNSVCDCVFINIPVIHLSDLAILISIPMASNIFNHYILYSYIFAVFSEWNKFSQLFFLSTLMFLIKLLYLCIQILWWSVTSVSQPTPQKDRVLIIVVVVSKLIQFRIFSNLDKIVKEPIHILYYSNYFLKLIDFFLIKSSSYKYNILSYL